jgi:hypothetical protein
MGARVPGGEFAWAALSRPAFDGGDRLGCRRRRYQNGADPFGPLLPFGHPGHLCTGYRTGRSPSTGGRRCLLCTPAAQHHF